MGDSRHATCNYQNIAVGDTCYLYNMSSKHLFGPWRITGVGLNLVGVAQGCHWVKRFLFQVTYEYIINDPGRPALDLRARHSGRYIEISNNIDVITFIRDAENNMLSQNDGKSVMKIDIKMYDIDMAKLIRGPNDTFKLHCPGLAEARPSVLKCDKLTLSMNGRGYEAEVSRVELEEAVLRVPRSFLNNYVNGAPIRVRFRFKRVQLITAHQGLDLLKHNCKPAFFGRVIFPKTSDFNNSSRILQTEFSNLTFVNRDLNDEQRKAVEDVVHGTCSPSPYLIYCPPGTGKTVTMVEAIYQTFKRSKTNRILICAPSNSACDIMTRYNHEQDGFVIPDVKSIKNHRIVAVTLAFAGKMYNLGLQNHFDHVFVDEAGHAIEPEAIGTISRTINKKSGSVVLAGDPKQLGPIIRSNLAKKFGLENSLLERLSERSEYMKVRERRRRRRRRTLLKKKSEKYADIKVGSVDEFQGPEKSVIVISTVSSSVEFIDFDTKYNLGFLASPKRFNVAITRARALLIVIGNPEVLATDENWRQYILHARENGGFTGPDWTPPEDIMDTGNAANDTVDYLR
ncbi:hypothetical protein TL16_g11266 [Triparma laevis f. inornata]|uniref:RNA helicase n=1 Tax=Triparma laevis f. inornata TaxID=1714386 RepID=A0A9W7BJI8_9STRA|nr:hypothetical protein TL16_g11266 [Triparma laevis f. inornata]